MKNKYIDNNENNLSENTQIRNSFRNTFSKNNNINDSNDELIDKTNDLSVDNNFVLIENKNTFNKQEIKNNSFNEFNLQIQFSNEITKQKIYNSFNKYENIDDKEKNFNEKKIIHNNRINKLFSLNYFKFLQKDKYRYAKNIECNKYNCFAPNICLDATFCKCGEEYANFNEDNPFINGNDNYDNNKIYCNYKRKKQIISFVLEFFLFFGMGHVYSGNYILGISKFIFFILLIIFKLKKDKNSKEIDIEEEENNNKNANWLHLMILLSAVIWYIIDIVFLALRKFIDGNGVPMLSW